MLEETKRQLGDDIYTQANLSQYKVPQNIQFVGLAEAALAVLRPVIIDETLRSVSNHLLDLGCLTSGEIQFSIEVIRRELLPPPVDPAIVAVTAHLTLAGIGGASKLVQAIVDAVRAADKK